MKRTKPLYAMVFAAYDVERRTRKVYFLMFFIMKCPWLKVLKINLVLTKKLPIFAHSIKVGSVSK